eukprot:5709141-Lingulodinium_polyedra.AAC.1
MRLIGGEFREWDSEWAMEGDSAAPGGQSERAAAERLLRMEAAGAQGHYSAQVLWDVEAFFDSIQVPRLVEDAVAHQLPVRATAMSLAVRTAPR